MRLQKILMRVAFSLITFGASVGLVEIGNFLSIPIQPLKLSIANMQPAPINKPIAIETESPKTTEDEIYVHRELSETGEEGYYYIIGTPAIEDNPKGFKEFRHFELTKSELDKKTNEIVPVKPTGSVWTKKEIINFVQFSMSGNIISFTTETQKGIYYQLEGKFVDETITVKDSDGENYTDTIVIKGLLIKWKNGVKIAKAEVNFGFTIGC